MIYLLAYVGGFCLFMWLVVIPLLKLVNYLIDTHLYWKAVEHRQRVWQLNTQGMTTAEMAEYAPRFIISYPEPH